MYLKIKTISVEFLSAGQSSVLYTKKNKEGIVVSKVSPYFALWQNLGDDVIISVGNDIPTRVQKGGCALFPSNCAQLCRRGQTTAPFNESDQWLYFEVIINGQYRMDDLYEFPEFLPKEYEAEIAGYISSISRLQKEDNTLCDRLSIMYKIIKILLSVAKRKKAVDDGVLRAIDYIKKNYRKQITVNRLSQIASMSESHFFRLFKKQTNVSPIAYINEYRLLMAAMLLENSGKSVSAVAADAGFNEAYYFSKLFMKRFKLSPTAYRKAIETSEKDKAAARRENAKMEENEKKLSFASTLWGA